MLPVLPPCLPKRFLTKPPAFGPVIVQLDLPGSFGFLHRFPIAREHGVSPTCPELALPWPADVPPVLSAKDTAAPGLSDAEKDGLLPSYDECRRYVAGLRTSTGRLAGGQ